MDFPTILSEARKYQLTLVIATQTLARLPPACLAAVFGNCATVVSFRVGGEDARCSGKSSRRRSPPRSSRTLPTTRATFARSWAADRPARTWSTRFRRLRQPARRPQRAPRPREPRTLRASTRPRRGADRPVSPAVILGVLGENDRSRRCTRQRRRGSPVEQLLFWLGLTGLHRGNDVRQREE